MSSRIPIFIALLFAVVSAGHHRAMADEQRVSQGFVVPGVYYNDLGDTSAVGLTNVCSRTIDVYWVLADEDDQVLARGQISLPGHHVTPFLVADLSGMARVGRAATVGVPAERRGVLIFATDTNGDGAMHSDDMPCLFAEAFHADVAANDAIYLPVWPFGVDDIAPPPAPVPQGISDLAHMDAAPLTTLRSGVVDPPGVSDALAFARYSIGGEDRTRLVVWSAEAAPMDAQMRFYRTDGANVTLSVPMQHSHLNVVDLEQLGGIPDDFTNGYVEWLLPQDQIHYSDAVGSDGNGVAIYTVIHAPALGAAQTILGRGDVVLRRP